MTSSRPFPNSDEREWDKMDISYFSHSMKNRRESDLENEIREWVLGRGATQIDDAVDLFDFSTTGRGFIAKR